MECWQRLSSNNNWNGESDPHHTSPCLPWSLRHSSPWGKQPNARETSRKSRLTHFCLGHGGPHARTHVRTHLSTHMHTQACTHTHMYMHTPTRTCMHAHMCTHMQMQIYTHTHTHTHMHKHARTCRHTHARTRIYLHAHTLITHTHACRHAQWHTCSTHSHKEADAKQVAKHYQTQNSTFVLFPGKRLCMRDPEWHAVLLDVLFSS